MHRHTWCARWVGTAVLTTATLASQVALAHGGDWGPVELGRGAVAVTFAQRDNLPHGLAADGRYVFVAEPLDGRVAVLSRATGREVAELPPPPGGFLLPFGARIDGDGQVVILDSGGFPSPTELAIPRVYVYQYQGHGRHFTATLTRSVMVMAPIIFAEELEVLAPGRYVISASGFGALWVVEADGSVTPGITPQTLNPEDLIPQLTACPFPPGGNVGGIPFAAPGDFAPGVGALGTDGQWLYMSGTCQGGVRRVPLAVFSDARPPWERAADIEEVFARPDGEIGTLKGLVFNRGNPRDHALYALEPFNLRVVRIDVDTGTRTVLLDNPELFNFPVSAAILPGHGPAVMVVASDQEHRWTALNAAIPEDVFTPPFLLSKAVILTHGH